MTLPPAFQSLPDDPPPAPDPPPVPEPATPGRRGPRVHPDTQIVEAGLGLLGPPFSGKTTFLAALPIAAEQYAPGWMFYGANDEAQDFLQENLRRLRGTRTLPAATMFLQPEMRFVAKGVRQTRRGGPLARTRRVQTAVYLDVLDAPGGLYAWSGPSGGSGLDSGAAPATPATGDEESDRDRLTRHVADSSGLILLVDPVLADSPGYDAYDYIKSVFLDITRRSALSSADEFLPHHLAVCMTKCDDSAVYGKAREFGLVTDGDDRRAFPKVSDRRAREFFDELCGCSRLDGPQGRAIELRDAIVSHFSPRRTRYFLTSSVGFGQHPVTGGFDPDDPSNLSHETIAADGREVPWLGGLIRPVNVIEPVLWLAGTQLRNGS